MFRPFIHIRMPWDREKPTENLRWATECIRVRWEAYKAIRVGEVYEVTDAEMYKTVRQRLKRMVQGDEGKLALFRLRK